MKHKINAIQSDHVFIENLSNIKKVKRNLFEKIHSPSNKNKVTLIKSPIIVPLSNDNNVQVNKLKTIAHYSSENSFLDESLNQFQSSLVPIKLENKLNDMKLTLNNNKLKNKDRRDSQFAIEPRTIDTNQENEYKKIVNLKAGYDIDAKKNSLNTLVELEKVSRIGLATDKELFKLKTEILDQNVLIDKKQNYDLKDYNELKTFLIENNLKPERLLDSIIDMLSQNSILDNIRYHYNLDKKDESLSSSEDEADEIVKLNYNGLNKIDSLDNFRSGSFVNERKKRKGFLCFNCF